MKTKQYNVICNVGKCKYLVTFCTGERLMHNLPLCDIRIFKNKVKRDKFINELKNQGYEYEF